MKTVAMVPARGSSKGIPRKNITSLNDLPLISYALTAALASDVQEVWVSTEDKRVADVVKELFPTVEILDRPKELAEDKVKAEPVLLHFAENVKFDVLVFIQCTSPLITGGQINEGLRYVLQEGFDSAFSVTTLHQFIWKGDKERLYPIQGYVPDDCGNRPRRQDLAEDQIYRLETGAFYITTRKALLNSRSRISGWIAAVEVPFWTSFEVDTFEDLHNIEKLLE